MEGTKITKKFDPWFDKTFDYERYPFRTHDHDVYLESVSTVGSDPKKHIIMVHGLTANSKICDICYKGYSLVRNYAVNGYTAWLIDISGHGQSEPWENPLEIKTKTGAEDICAAAELIKAEFGEDATVDVLGWSWGTMTGSEASLMRPELFRKLVLFAPPTPGFMEMLPEGTFDNQPEADFQYLGTARLFPIKGVPGGQIPPADFEFDESRVEIGMVDHAIHAFFRYVGGGKRPNGPASEIMCGPVHEYVQWDKIQHPTFVAYGDDDMYVDVALEEERIKLLPEGSDHFLQKGGCHGVPFQKNSIVLHTAVLEWLAK